MFILAPATIKKYMTESTDKYLETSRFRISPETRVILNNLKPVFKDLQSKYPYLSGVGLFGSRVKGLEKNSSDVDLCIFYNSERMDPDKPIKPEWQDILDSIHKKLGVRLDYRINKTTGGQKIDISKRRTDIDIDNYVSSLSNYDIFHLSEDDLLSVSDIPPTSNLLYRFFLAFGDELYENRKYILNRFKSMKNGEQYFQILMRSLSNFERDVKKPFGTPSYEHYPGSIEEAEKYFLTN